MERAKHLTLSLYRHHFIRYLLVGGSTFALDFGSLVLLHGGLGLTIVIATTVAYWASIIYNFLLNRYWTFDVWEQESLHRHITSYCILLVVNYVFTVIFIALAIHHVNYIMAKVIAVIIQMVWTYQIYKKFIFISHAS